MKLTDEQVVTIVDEYIVKNYGLYKGVSPQDYSTVFIKNAFRSPKYNYLSKVKILPLSVDRIRGTPGGVTYVVGNFTIQDDYYTLKEGEATETDLIPVSIFRTLLTPKMQELEGKGIYFECNFIIEPENKLPADSPLSNDYKIFAPRSFADYASPETVGTFKDFFGSL